MATIAEGIEAVAITGTDAAAAFKTDLGWMAVDCSGGVLRGLVFGHGSERSATAALRRILKAAGVHHGDTYGRELDESNDLLPELIERLNYYAAGDAVDFHDVAIDDFHLTRFGRRVVKACRKIGWGQVRTYGQLAAAGGSPGAARAVGQVMATNRYPLVVPCHRVVAASGRLGGFSAPQGVNMKRRLLEMEQSVAVI